LPNDEWGLVHTKQAAKDAELLISAGLRRKTELLIGLITQNPFQNPPSFEKLGGDLVGYYSRRINRQHRLVYEVLKKERIVKIIRMWTHYE